MSKELSRRLNRVGDDLGPLASDDAFGPFRAIAAKVLEDPEAIAPTKAYCDWLAEKCKGQRLTLRQMYARLEGWLREDPRGIDLVCRVAPFLDKAAHG